MERYMKGGILFTLEDGSVFWWIETHVWDICRWLESWVDYVVHGIFKAADWFVHFVVEINWKYFWWKLQFLVDIIKAVVWCIKIVVITYEMALKFFLYLFELKDIIRCEKVINNIIKTFAIHCQSQIWTLKGEIDGAFDDIKKKIDDWSGVDFPDLKGTAWNLDTKNSSWWNVPSNLMTHHFVHNASNASSNEPSNDSSITDDTKKALEDFEGVVKNEWTIFEDMWKSFEKTADNLFNQPLWDTVKQALGTLGDWVVESMKNIADGSLNLASVLSMDVGKALEMKIHIPVISDILEDFWIPDFSIAEINSFILAVGCDVMYKEITDWKPPFDDDNYTKSLIEAKDFDTVINLIRWEENNLSLDGYNISKHSIRGISILNLIEAGAILISAVLNIVYMYSQTDKNNVRDTSKTFIIYNVWILQLFLVITQIIKSSILITKHKDAARNIFYVYITSVSIVAMIGLTFLVERCLGQRWIIENANYTIIILSPFIFISYFAPCLLTIIIIANFIEANINKDIRNTIVTNEIWLLLAQISFLAQAIFS